MDSRISVEQNLFSMTTIIFAEHCKESGFGSFQASGFFFTKTTPLSSHSNKQNGHWERLDKFWLVTNRHVVLHKVNDIEYLAEKFTFNLRKSVNGKIDWHPITLTRNELQSSLLVHSNEFVDVAVIDVTKYIESILNTEDELRKQIDIPAALSQNNLPEKQPIVVEVTSDVIVASYPKGFYDRFNKFPIIKSGIIASGWNLRFNGKPMFQIDSQLFPGSSGGLVISKPTNVIINNGEILYSRGGKQYVLLGVYSGEYSWDEFVEIESGKFLKQKRSYGLGNVWYSYLIVEIINNGVKFV